MFGKRSETATAVKSPVNTAAVPKPQEAKPVQVAVNNAPNTNSRSEPSEEYYETKATIFNALFETIDVSALAGMQPDKAREEIRTIVDEIIAIRNVRLSVAEQNQLITEICDDILGYGPLEPLLERDDIADIMVNGAKHVFIETNGKVQKTNIRFRDNTQLMNICQRIVSQVGRRVDEASPICDARLLDGSRVNVIAPPLSIDGPALTIRKFKKDKLQLSDLVNFKSISPAGARAIWKPMSFRKWNWPSGQPAAKALKVFPGRAIRR